MKYPISGKNFKDLGFNYGFFDKTVYWDIELQGFINSTLGSNCN